MQTETSGTGHWSGNNSYEFRDYEIQHDELSENRTDEMLLETHLRSLPNTFNPSNDRQITQKYIPVGPITGSHIEEAEIPLGRTEERTVRRKTATLLRASSTTSTRERSPSPSSTPPSRDPFLPFPNDPGITEQENPLTLRAIFIGLLFGSVVNAGRLYTGYAVGSDFFALIVGFAVIKGLTRLVPRINWLGGPFGPRELAVVSTVATAAAGTSTIFATTVPAMFKLDLLGTPQSAFGPLLLLTLVCTFGGLFSAAPLRNFFIIRSARDLNIRFPRSEAMAITIRALHEAGTDAKKGSQRVKAMLFAFSAAFAQQIAAQYARGIVYDWHVFTWFYSWSNYTNDALYIENWGWYFTWTPSFWGLGMLIGLNMAASMFLGSVLAYGIIGPMLVSTGEAIGQQNPIATIAGLEWKDYVTFIGGPIFDPSGGMIPSPWYWLLWPGIVLIIFSSVTELLLQLSHMLVGMKAASREMTQGLLQRFHHRKAKYDPYGEDIQKSIKSDLAEYSGKDVSPWIWMGGMVIVIVAACLNAQFQWHFNPGWLVLGLILSIFLGFLNMYGEGSTGIAPPISDIFVLLVFGAIAVGISATANTKMLLVLVATITVGGVSEVANTLMGDYRMGFLLKLSPRIQFLAQGIGTLVSGLTSVGIFTLFAEVYPCLLEIDATPATCPLPAQMALQTAVLLPNMLDENMHDAVPTSAAICAAVAGVIAVTSSLISHFWLRGERAIYRKWMPNWMAVGIAFVLPNTYIGTAMLCGALTAHFWGRARPGGYERFGVVVAAGMIAGEGVGGLGGAVLNIAGVGSERFGVGVGCPGGRCA